MARWTQGWRANFMVLGGTVGLLLLVDRLLLAMLGLPLWVADPVLHYKHRPGAVEHWGAYDDKPIRINRHGHHDDEFPVARPANELRVLNLGDSITMGHGVTRDETYSNQLEALLAADTSARHESYQVINAGVQGYATFQEREVLRRSFVFEPDLVTLAFCLNDLTEPFEVNERYGGEGFDYHRVVQASSRVVSYLLNETGYGRLAHELRLRMGLVGRARRQETEEIRAMIAAPDSLVVRERWGIVLAEMSALYRQAHSRRKPVVLLIFPFRFQLFDPAGQWPQERLKAHARAHGVPFVDFIGVFEARIHAGEGAVDDYFLDASHLTVRGHAVVAQVLRAHLDEWMGG